MKKEIIAAALLAGVFALSMLNVRHLGKIADSVLAEAAETVECAEKDDWESASGHADRAMGLWDENLRYLRLVLRSADSDGVHNSIAELGREVKNENAQSVRCAYDSAEYYLNGIADAERIKIESIF